MSIQVTCCSVKLTENSDPLQVFDLSLDPVREIRKFFPDSAWRGRLAMSPAHHWDVSVFMSQILKTALKILERWHQHILE